jgi:DNA-directed RNA polymerase subunit omega
MARTTHDTMMEPPVENLLGHVDSKFRLVTLAARRARQINSYFNHLGDSMGAMVPPQVTSVARKPLSIAFEEIAADKIEFVPVEPGDELLLVEGTVEGAVVGVEPGGATEVLVEAEPVDGGSGE